MDPMTGALIAGGASLLSGALGASGSKKTAKAILKAAETEEIMGNVTRNAGLAMSAPYREASYTALAGLMDMIGLSRTGGAAPGGKVGGPTGPYGLGHRDTTDWMLSGLGKGSAILANQPDYNWQESPSYSWRFNEGYGAALGSLGARGLSASGAELKELTAYGQGMASQEYDTIFRRLAAVAGFGDLAANTSTSAFGTAAGQSSSSALLRTTAAGGYMGQSNAWANALNQVAMLPWDQILTKSRGQTTMYDNMSNADFGY